MKTTELMIGDWMQFANGNKKCMVVGIKCNARFLINEATITVMDSSGHWCWWDIFFDVLGQLLGIGILVLIAWLIFF